LIRKEFCLLRPVWLITLLAALSWTWLTAVWLLHHRTTTKSFDTVATMVGVSCTLMIAILAGSSSLGEERSSGTHAWQLTLPAAALLQWGVKLSMALGAAALGAWLLPALIAGRSFFISSNLWGSGNFSPTLLIAVLLLTFAAFWCACATNGTVSAVLWVAPAAIFLGLVNYFAQQSAYALVPFRGLFSFNSLDALSFAWFVTGVAHPHYREFNLLTSNLRFDWWVTNFSYRHYQVWNVLSTPAAYAVLVGGPALLLAIIQSYRLFRAQPRASARLVRNLLPLALLIFLCGFSLTLFNGLWPLVTNQVPGLLGATNGAIQKAIPTAARTKAQLPLQLTLEDVAAAWPLVLPENTRRWLTHARITVTPDKAHPGGFYCEEDRERREGWRPCYYSATIHLADGTEIFESYEPAARHGPGSGRFGTYSVYVYWPGAARPERLWDR
jgi:hypothetical protein